MGKWKNLVGIYGVLFSPCPTTGKFSEAPETEEKKDIYKKKHSRETKTAVPSYHPSPFITLDCNRWEHRGEIVDTRCRNSRDYDSLQLPQSVKEKESIETLHMWHRGLLCCPARLVGVLQSARPSQRAPQDITQYNSQ